METRCFILFTSHRSAERRLCFDGEGGEKKISADEKGKVEGDLKAKERKAEIAVVSTELSDLRKRVEDASKATKGEIEAEVKNVGQSILRTLDENEAALRHLNPTMNPKQVRERVQKLLADPSSEGARQELASILVDISPNRIQAFLKGNGDPVAFENRIRQTLTKSMGEAIDSTPLLKSARDYLGVTNEQAVSFLFELFRGTVAKAMATFVAPSLEGTRLMESVRRFGRDLHLRSALEAEASERGIVIPQGSRTEAMLKLLTGAGKTFENETAQQEAIKRWDDLYRIWSSNARRLKVARSPQSPGRVPGIADALTADAGKKYVADIGATEDPAKTKAAADKQQKEEKEKFDKTRVTDTLGFGAYGGNIEITQDRPAVLRYDGRDIYFRKAGTDHYEMRIGDEPRWIRLQSGTAADGSDAANITHLRLWAPRTGNEMSGVKVTINDNSDQYRNLGYLVDNARRDASVRRIVYQSNGSTPMLA